MNVGARISTRRVPAVLTAFAFVTATACQPIGVNRQQYFHGAAFTADGLYLEAASLSPACGCVTLRNPGSDNITLHSELYGLSHGNAELAGNAQLRVRFDWAGAEDEDRYAIWASSPGGEILPAREAFEMVGPVIESPCTDDLCQFGALGMNRAFTASAATNDGSRGESWIRFINGGQTMEVASLSSNDGCGCLVLENRAPDDFTLTATFQSNRRGQSAIASNPVGDTAGGAVQQRGSLIFIGFDWAGPLDEDVYILSAYSNNIDAPNGATTNRMSPATNSRQLNLAEQVGVVAQISQLECTEEGAVPAFSPSVESLADGGFASEQRTLPMCPFAPYGMNRMNMEYQP